MHARSRRALASALALVVSVSVTACGAGQEGATVVEASATEHNDADEVFASQMLQHHAQALSLVDLTLERPLDPKVVNLTEEIRAVQGPEIETLTDWLVEWDQEIPATMRDHSNAAHDGASIGEAMEGITTNLPGMLSGDDFTALEQASDDDFPGMWLALMIQHHDGATGIAQDYAQAGRYQPALDLAEDIVEAQTAQTETLRALSSS